ncbi:glycosyltransferase family 1 protein [Roseovarius sp. Pro17]|uniref:glycosyltransferase n=1 Tax=Roseovarius sp. Pro17 TaxID=3108175 RepID=UPI002D785848|nr:glycosyltransferase family 1 protein [Roseovarius sp. Pro17]
MLPTLDALAGKYALARPVNRPATLFLGRPFTKGARKKLVIYYEPNSISFTQVYPFLYYQDTLKARFGLEVRCYPVTKLLAGGAVRHDDADIVLLQAWFTVSEDTLQDVFGRLVQANPQASISFMDTFAHSDIRMARHLEPNVDFYLKKSVFRDEQDFLRPFRGGTNLTEYYGDLYGIDADPIDWNVPESMVEKLRLSPNFFTDPRFLHDFATKDAPSHTDRPIDIQTRFGIRGTDWYQAMRQQALDRVRAIPGLKLSAPDTISWAKYMQEMRHSKLCLSPFGYGELCWRDVEAVATGSVLIKPDMSHLDTRPDIYEAGVTYLPIKWDFSDLEDVVQMALSDAGLRRDITQNAYQRVAEYVRDKRFVDDMAFLFDKL